MKRPFDFTSYRECLGFTLVGSSLIALVVGIAAVVAGANVATVETLMTKLSIPWFVFWYVWCRATSQVWIRITNGTPQ